MISPKMRLASIEMWRSSARRMFGPASLMRLAELVEHRQQLGHGRLFAAGGDQLAQQCLGGGDGGLALGDARLDALELLGGAPELRVERARAVGREAQRLGFEAYQRALVGGDGALVFLGGRVRAIRGRGQRAPALRKTVGGLFVFEVARVARTGGAQACLQRGDLGVQAGEGLERFVRGGQASVAD